MTPSRASEGHPLACASPDCHHAPYCRGLCRHHYDRLKRDHGPYRPLPYGCDELLDEWVFMRGFVPFEEFGPRVGLKQASWKRAFERARALGDPRAVRARSDWTAWPDPAAGLSRLVRNRRTA